VRLRPVYIHDSGGALYQSGSRYLSKFELAEKVRFIAEMGIVMLIDVDTNGGSQELEMYTRYRHVPFGDNKQFHPHMPEVIVVAEEAAEVLAEGRSVLSCCQYGTNRSGLVNALVIRESEGCSGAEALQRLKILRRGACGGNQHFITWLNEIPEP
jgi:protein tyrosine/serine phosphatase